MNEFFCFCLADVATVEIPLIEFNFIYYINFNYVCWCVEKDLNNLHNQKKKERKISLRRCWSRERESKHCLMMMGSGSWISLLLEKVQEYATDE